MATRAEHYRRAEELVSDYRHRLELGDRSMWERSFWGITPPALSEAQVHATLAAASDLVERQVRAAEAEEIRKADHVV